MHSPIAKTGKATTIRLFLLEAIKSGRLDYLQSVANLFGITRQAVHRHLADLVTLGYLTAEGNTRNRIYRIGRMRWHTAVYDITAVDESTAYQRDFHFVFKDLPENIEEICHYGFTEMFNNALDHSEGRKLIVNAERTATSVTITIADDGEGIFLRIARLMGLPDPRESLLELSKGKLTTDPDHHTGKAFSLPHAPLTGSLSSRTTSSSRTTINTHATICSTTARHTPAQSSQWKYPFRAKSNSGRYSMTLAAARTTTASIKPSCPSDSPSTKVSA